MDEFPKENCYINFTKSYFKNLNQNNDLVAALKLINSSYSEIDCLALPYPGKTLKFSILKTRVRK